MAAADAAVVVRHTALSVRRLLAVEKHLILNSGSHKGLVHGHPSIA
jgi:hypothetical protein